MSRTRIIGGKYTEIVQGDITEISAANIEDNGLFVNNFAKGKIYYQNNKDNDIIDDYIIDAYWTDTKDRKIDTALLGETVRFHVTTKADNITVLAQVYKWNRIRDIRLGSINNITIKGNAGYFDFKLNKEKWRELFDGVGEGEELKLFCEIYCRGNDTERGKYLKVKNGDDVIIFLIGGAADKEWFGVIPSTHLVQPLISDIYNGLGSLQTKVTIYYLDYSDTYEDQYDRFQTNILDRIKDNNKDNIYIIGHSLGGWNGAHLSQILTDKGDRVRMLITLDPVGVNFKIKAIASIYWSMPKPKADYWINVSIDPEKHKGKIPDSDWIANEGGRWIPKSGPNINSLLDATHEDVYKLFRSKLTTGKSAMDYLLEDVKSIMK